VEYKNPFVLSLSKHILQCDWSFPFDKLRANGFFLEERIV